MVRGRLAWTILAIEPVTNNAPLSPSHVSRITRMHSNQGRWIGRHHSAELRALSTLGRWMERMRSRAEPMLCRADGRQ